VSVELVEKQIVATRRETLVWIWFLRLCILGLIGFGIWWGFFAITRPLYCWLMEGVIVPLIVVTIKAHSDQNKVNIDFISALNSTQAISNDQNKTKAGILLEKLEDIDKGEKE
jgi:hypothetical protein